MSKNIDKSLLKGLVRTWWRKFCPPVKPYRNTPVDYSAPPNEREDKPSYNIFDTVDCYELGKVEGYREAVDDMVILRDKALSEYGDNHWDLEIDTIFTNLKEQFEKLCCLLALQKNEKDKGASLTETDFIGVVCKTGEIQVYFSLGLPDNCQTVIIRLPRNSVYFPHLILKSEGL